MIALLSFFISGAAEATLVVIANPHFPVNAVTRNQLASLYLGKPSSLRAHAIPYNELDNTPAFQEFYQQILGWDADRVSSYWASQVFSGYSQEPQAVNSDQAAIQLVQQNSSAIAYVDSDSLRNVGNTVKVIYGHYKIPVQRRRVERSHRAIRRSSFRKAKAKIEPQQQPGRLYSSAGTNGYMTALTFSDPDSDTSTNTSGPETDPDLNLAQQLNEINNAAGQGGQTQNIWNLIASHMTLQNEDNHPDVRHWIIWFQQHPKVLSTMIDNATPYLYYVYQQTQRRHMPAEFTLLPMIESGYNPRAYSSKGAAGLWQLMPGTASGYGMAIDWWYDARRDILTATNAGLNFLVYLHHHTHTWPLAAAAYNWGPGALDGSIRRNKARGKPTDFWDLKLPNETEQYLPKLLALSAIIANPSKYGIQLPFVPDRPSFGSVTLTSQMDLQEISQFSGVPIPILKALNPGVQRWATAPKGDFTFLLPVTAVHTFEVNLQGALGKTHTGWEYHRVVSGDTLPSLATQYSTTVALLTEANRLEGKALKLGQGILVPIQNSQTYTKLAGATGAVKSMETSQEKILSNALTRAVQSQQKALPPEVTGEPIKANDDLKSLVSKLYGKS